MADRAGNVGLTSLEVHRARPRERGVTIVEALVATTILAVAGIALYGLLDSSNHLAKQETNVAVAQQAARTGMSELARVVRQARAGQLFYGNAVLPIANNSAGGTRITDVSGANHYIRKGTDVIAVRGVLQGDRYRVTGGDVTCGSVLCSANTPMTVTIRSTSENGVVNFPSGGLPALSMRDRPFYFAVLYGTLQTITISNTAFLTPLYSVGLVDATGSWYSSTADTFTFTMDPRDAGARKLNAVAVAVSELVQSPYSCGAVDEILFFVDEGSTNSSTSLLDTHPSLAEAILDPSSGRYDVQPLVDDVEDFQVAYGIDGADGSVHDRGISPVALDASAAGKDEWVGNVATEVESVLTFSTTEPYFIGAFIDTTVPPGVPNLFPRAVPALRSVWLSLVVKASDPDYRYAGPGARGIQILDSTAISFSSASITGLEYRRRVTTLAVSLRNFQ
jgi:type II secretory pathway pseudopilin PulG